MQKIERGISFFPLSKIDLIFLVYTSVSTRCILKKLLIEERFSTFQSIHYRTSLALQNEGNEGYVKRGIQNSWKTSEVLASQDPYLAISSGI